MRIEDLKKDFDINKVLESLSKKRELFHCEADFQFALAEEIKNFYENIDIRLEYFYKEDKKDNDERKNEENKNDHRQYIDILVIYNNKECIPIELKYKTNREEVIILDKNEEEYHLKKQGAKNDSSFYIIKDLERIEKIVSNNESKTYNLNHYIVVKGYVIFLTPYECYKTNILKHRDKTISQFNLASGNEKSIVTIKSGKKIYKEKYEVDLTSEYHGEWSIYSKYKKNNVTKNVYQLIFNIPD